jgi:hypothetical protein
VYKTDGKIVNRIQDNDLQIANCKKEVTMPRTPAVANMFYPGNRGRLKEQLDSFVEPVPEPRKVLGAISPHAGYMYSGGVAGAVFSQILIPETVVIVGLWLWMLPVHGTCLWDRFRSTRNSPA